MDFQLRIVKVDRQTTFRHFDLYSSSKTQVTIKDSALLHEETNTSQFSIPGANANFARCVVLLSVTTAICLWTLALELHRSTTIRGGLFLMAEVYTPPARYRATCGQLRAPSHQIVFRNHDSSRHYFAVAKEVRYRQYFAHTLNINGQLLVSLALQMKISSERNFNISCVQDWNHNRTVSPPVHTVIMADISVAEGVREGSHVIEGPDKHTYHFNRQMTGGRISLRCAFSKSEGIKCRGRASVAKSGTNFKSTQAHNHPRRLHYFQAKIFRHRVLKRCRDADWTPLRLIYNQERRKLRYVVLWVQTFQSMVLMYLSLYCYRTFNIVYQ